MLGHILCYILNFTIKGGAKLIKRFCFNVIIGFKTAHGLADMAKKYENELFGLDIEKLFEKECYVLLKRIKSILEDDSLNDKDCFEKIKASCAGLKK